MFDIAWSELLVIVVVALVVVGPKDLPRLMRKAGQWAGRARAMADQFRRSFDDLARQTELDELRREVHRMQSQQPMTDADYRALGIELNPLDDPANVAQAQADLEATGRASLSTPRADEVPAVSDGSVTAPMRGET